MQFLLDPSERRLTRSGRGVAVPAKAWQILLMLVEAGGRLMPHETLRARLWPNIVVEERTLTVHVSTLRKALGDGANVIETVPRAGYRLAVPVHMLSTADSPSQAADATPIVAIRPFSTGALAEPDTYLGVGMADALTTARALGRQLLVLKVDTAQELVAAFSTLLNEHTDALFIHSHPFFDATEINDRLVALTLRNAVPAISSQRAFPAAGGLMSYGADSGEAYRQAGIMRDGY